MTVHANSMFVRGGWIGSYGVFGVCVVCCVFAPADVSITHLAFGKEFTKAIEMKQVAQQEAERSKFLVMRAEQEKQVRASTVCAVGGGVLDVCVVWVMSCPTPRPCSPYPHPHSSPTPPLCHYRVRTSAFLSRVGTPTLHSPLPSPESLLCSLVTTILPLVCDVLPPPLPPGCHHSCGG